MFPGQTEVVRGAAEVVVLEVLLVVDFVELVVTLADVVTLEGVLEDVPENILELDDDVD